MIAVKTKESGQGTKITVEFNEHDQVSTEEYAEGLPGDEFASEDLCDELLGGDMPHGPSIEECELFEDEIDETGPERDCRHGTEFSKNDVSDDQTDIWSLTCQELGRKGEDAAVRYLASRGYEILERNWTCPFGEVDIIAEDPCGTICFVEVKTRRGVSKGMPEEAVTAEKRRRYEKIALCYMMDAEWEDGLPIRFDCIGILVGKKRRALLKHHKGFFDESF